VKIAFHPIYCHPLPEGHRFPMEKYELIPEQLLYEGVVEPSDFFEPKTMDDAIILRVHSADYLEKLNSLTLSDKEARKIGLPLSAQLVQREKLIMQGTLDCCFHAFTTKVAFNIAGGTHHAYAASGEGFCLLNDCAIAAQYLLDHKLAKNILIIDLDVHQGNGTASIFQDSTQVYTFSMHGADNYPLHKEKSDWDIALPTKTSDLEYITILKQSLVRLEGMKPFDFVFYVAGVDVLATDKLGKLSLSPEACATRDELVFEFAKAQKTPIVVTMGGGYSVKLSDIVNAHCNTYKKAKSVFY
jgi:acetoin utilization deacetylase AcuC-like enzyme